MPKTALELTPQDWQEFRPSTRPEKNYQPSVQRHREEAWRVAREAARLLYEKYRAKKVVVFGSLIHPAWFSLESDIDLAAWGIPPELFYQAVAALAGMSAVFRIDLVDPESCRASLRTVIESEGIEL